MARDAILVIFCLGAHCSWVSSHTKNENNGSKIDRVTITQICGHAHMHNRGSTLQLEPRCARNLVRLRWFFVDEVAQVSEFHLPRISGIEQTFAELLAPEVLVNHCAQKWQLCNLSHFWAPDGRPISLIFGVVNLPINGSHLSKNQRNRSKIDRVIGKKQSVPKSLEPLFGTFWCQYDPATCGSCCDPAGDPILNFI